MHNMNNIPVYHPKSIGPFKLDAVKELTHLKESYIFIYRHDSFEYYVELYHYKERYGYTYSLHAISEKHNDSFLDFRFSADRINKFDKVENEFFSLMNGLFLTRSIEEEIGGW